MNEVAALGSIVSFVAVVAGLSCGDPQGQTRLQARHPLARQSASAVSWGAPEPTVASPTASAVPATAAPSAATLTGDFQKGAPYPTDSPAPVQNAEGVIRSRLFPAAKRCYQQVLNQDPTAMGRVAITVEVNPDGTVRDAKFSTSEGLPVGVATCIAQAARKLEFAPPCGTGSTINVPFRFERGNADAGAPPSQ